MRGRSVPSTPGAHGDRWRVGEAAPVPPELRPESEITATWVGERPVVSVLCSTYQHGGFIEDAIRGFLGQRTTFPLEVIIRDDASTDGTAEIVADFAARYPAIIRAVLEPENRWRQPRPHLRSMARGEFIARCEGDDYWIDPHKLETQVATLRAHPDAVLSHHDALVVEDGLVTGAGRLPSDNRRDYPADELKRGKLALLLTILHRNVPIERHPRHDQILNADKFLMAQLGQYGEARWEPDVLPAVYRVHPGGVFSGSDPIERELDMARSYLWIGEYFRERDPEVAQSFLAKGLDRYVRGLEFAGADLHAMGRRLDSRLRQPTRIRLRERLLAIPGRLRKNR
jgi:glycosyltransferase involved in cell wall biosynthesis